MKGDDDLLVVRSSILYLNQNSICKGNA